MLKIIRKPVPKASPKGLILMLTPMTCYGVRRLQYTYTQTPASPLLAKIFRANKKLAAGYSINKYIITRLVKINIYKKRKRKRVKHLNLLGEEDISSQFFSPAYVQATRDYQAAKKEAEIQRQQAIDNKKVQTALKK